MERLGQVFWSIAKKRVEETALFIVFIDGQKILQETYALYTCKFKYTQPYIYPMFQNEQNEQRSIKMNKNRSFGLFSGVVFRRSYWVRALKKAASIG